MSPMVRRPPGMEVALLGYLRQGPVHGYQLHQLVTDPEGLGPIWNLKQSQLYALLSKLEQDGFIRGGVEPQEPTRPPRKIYHMTAAGKTAYEKWMQSPVHAHHQMRQEFMAKLYFAQLEGVGYVRILADAQWATCQKWLESLTEEEVAPQTFMWFLRQYRIGQIKAELAWLENNLLEF